MNYVELFKEKKWFEAFDAIPLNKTRIVELAPEDFMTIRVRATDYNKSHDNKRISISIDYTTHLAAISAKRPDDNENAE